MSTVDPGALHHSITSGDASLYRSIFERATDGIAIIAPDGRYVEQNAAHERMMGWTIDELRNVTPAVHLGQETTARVLRRLQQDGHFMGEVESRNRHGAVRTVELAAFAVHDGDGVVLAYVGAKRDVSERLAAQREMHRRYEQLQSIYRMTATLVGAEDLQTIFREGLDCLTAALDTTRASILLIDPDGVMRFKDWRNLSDQYRQAVEGHTPWSPDERNPQAFVISDVAAAESLGDVRDTILGEGIAAAAFVPIVFEGRLLGKFMLYFAEPHEMSAEDLLLAETVAGHIAFAIARRTAAEALVQRERVFEALAENSPDIIARFDREYRHLYVNPTIELATGVPAGAFIGRTNAELGNPPEATAQWHALLDQVFRTGDAADQEFTFDTPGGRRHFHARAKPELVDEDGVHTVLCTTRDVTLLKRAEERQRLLAETGGVLVSYMSYREALVAVAELVIQSFAEGCAIDLLAADGRLERLAVVTRDARHLKTITELEARFPTPADAPAGHVTAFRTGESQLYTEFPDEMLRAASQSDEHFRLWKSLEMSGCICVPLAARGRTIGVITFVVHQPSAPFTNDDLVFAEELAGRIALAMDNLRLYEASLAANQTKSDFMATMSHELRTPLNAIMGYTELLELRISGELTQAQSSQLERIRASTNHLLTVIEEILTFSRVDAGKETVLRERVDVLELARAAGAMVEPAALQKGLAFVNVVPDGTVMAGTDPVKLRQVLLNLLSNAVKFTESGRVRFDTRLDGEYVVFTVSDTGIGIAAEHHEKVFEPFWQVEAGAKRRTGGTGLGLTVCRQLSELLGAELTMRSEPGVGSTFTMRLPLATPVPA
jgi:PAS domain S-box-containing protein